MEIFHEGFGFYAHEEAAKSLQPPLDFTIQVRVKQTKNPGCHHGVRNLRENEGK